MEHVDDITCVYVACSEFGWQVGTGHLWLSSTSWPVKSSKKIGMELCCQKMQFLVSKTTYGFWWSLETASSVVRMMRTVRKWECFYFSKQCFLKKASCSKHNLGKSIPKRNEVSCFNPNQNIFSVSAESEKRLFWVILKLISLPHILLFRLLNQEVSLFCSSSSEYPEKHLLWLVQGLDLLKHTFEILLHVVILSVICERTSDCYNTLASWNFSTGTEK